NRFGRQAPGQGECRENQGNNNRQHHDRFRQCCTTFIGNQRQHPLKEGDRSVDYCRPIPTYYLKFCSEFPALVRASPMVPRNATTTPMIITAMNPISSTYSATPAPRSSGSSSWVM